MDSRSSPERNSDRHSRSASNDSRGLKARLLNSRVILALLALLAILIYSNTFHVPFHFDDTFNIVANPKIKHLANLLHLSGPRFVGFLTFALNYRFGGLHVFGYHLVNLLIHIANGFLVYLVVRALFTLSYPRAAASPAALPGMAPWVALFTAALFVAHPIQTQAVTYIVQRFTSLAALFYLLTILCYLRWRLDPRQGPSRYLWYAAALFSTLLAMKTRENTFTLPFMILLIEAVFFRPVTLKAGIRLFTSLIPFLLTLLIIPLSIPLSRLSAMGGGTARGGGVAARLTRETLDISRWDYLFTQFRVLITYLRLLILPVHQNLDYDYPLYHSLLDPPVLLSALVLLVLFAAALYLLRFPLKAFPPLTSRVIGFGILWFFLTLSVESSIIPIRDVIYEHRLYLPSVGVLLVFGVFLGECVMRWRTPTVLAFTAVLVLFSAATYQRNAVWKDELTLWSDVVRKSPKKARGHYNLGISYAQLKRTDDAIAQYQIALKSKPDDADIHNNLGVALAAQGFLEQALIQHRIVLQLRPHDANAHNNMGIILKLLGRPEEAAKEYHAALDANPDFAQAHSNLGVVLKMLGRKEEAVQEYETAIRLDPDNAEVHFNLGNAKLEMKQFDQAISEYQKAINLDPEYAVAYINMGMAYYQQDMKEDALRALSTAVGLRPNIAEAHNILGVLYKDMGRTDQAIQEFQMAVKLKPTLAEAYYNLGESYKQIGQVSASSHAFENALRVRPDYEKARQALESNSK
jgi:protein O-mannosyl-transferase